MKTFEEALRITNGSTGRSLQEWEATEGQNAGALAVEVLDSDLYNDFCDNAIVLALHKTAGEDAETLLGSLFTTAFVAGMRVGIEMEKQELPAGVDANG